MRRVAVALSALSLSIVILFSVTLFRISVTGAAMNVSPQPTTEVQQTVTKAPDGTEAIADDEVPLAAGTEQIADDEVPLAASPEEEQGGVPIPLLLGAGIAFVAAFFLLRIRSVNDSIASMNGKLFHK